MVDYITRCSVLRGMIAFQTVKTRTVKFRNRDTFKLYKTTIFIGTLSWDGSLFTFPLECWKVENNSKQERTKSKRVTLPYRPYSKVIPLKLFLDVVPSSYYGARYVIIFMED